MASKREPVPALRGSARPLIPTAPDPAPEAPKNVKVMVYLPPGMVDMLDQLRIDLRREGLTVDRSALIRAAIRRATANETDWGYWLGEEVS